jgi:hypothetical protein
MSILFVTREPLATSQHNGHHFSCSDILFEFLTAKCAKCVGDRIEGCHRVRSASAVRMGTVTFNVTFKVTSRHFQ